MCFLILFGVFFEEALVGLRQVYALGAGFCFRFYELTLEYERVLRIIYDENARLRVERLIREEVSVVLGILIELLVGIVRIHIACLFDGDNQGLIGELFVCHGTVDFLVVIQVEVQLHQITLFQSLTAYGILPKTANMWNDSK